MNKMAWTKRWSASAAVVFACLIGSALAAAMIADNVKTPFGCGKGWSLVAIAGH